MRQMGRKADIRIHPHSTYSMEACRSKKIEKDQTRDSATFHNFFDPTRNSYLDRTGKDPTHKAAERTSIPHTRGVPRSKDRHHNCQMLRLVSGCLARVVQYLHDRSIMAEGDPEPYLMWSRATRRRKEGWYWEHPKGSRGPKPHSRA